MIQEICILWVTKEWSRTQLNFDQRFVCLLRGVGLGGMCQSHAISVRAQILHLCDSAVLPIQISAYFAFLDRCCLVRQQKIECTIDRSTRLPSPRGFCGQHFQFRCTEISVTEETLHVFVGLCHSSCSKPQGVIALSFSVWKTKGEAAFVRCFVVLAVFQWRFHVAVNVRVLGRVRFLRYCPHSSSGRNHMRYLAPNTLLYCACQGETSVEVSLSPPPIGRTFFLADDFRYVNIWLGFFSANRRQVWKVHIKKQ